MSEPMALSKEDWDTLRMVFEAGYESALEQMQPCGPIGFSGTVADAWGEYHALLAARKAPAA